MWFAVSASATFTGCFQGPLLWRIPLPVGEEGAKWWSLEFPVT